MSSRRQKSQVSEQVRIASKYIVFRNPKTKEIVTKIQVPKYIRMSKRQICDVTQLKKKLKMLYIDVVHRGYHPVKGFEKEARNVFVPFELDDLNYNEQVDHISEVSCNQALGTIWRCIGRQAGKPIKKYELESVQKQLSDELNSLKNECKLKKGVQQQQNPDVAKHMKLCQQLKKLQQKIQKEIQTVRLRYDQQKQKEKQNEKSIRNVVQQQIMSLEKQIFIRSIVGARQLEQNTSLIELVMEQSYPSIKMKRQIAIRLLGEQIVKQKEDKYQQYTLQYDLYEKNIIVCHRCLIPVNQMVNGASCNDQCASLNVGHTILSDPYMYNRIVLNENSSEPQITKYIHPYLIYYRAADKDTVALCNRYYCNKCVGLENLSLSRGHCSYCEGICTCFRCQGMDSLTKMMAIYIDNGGDLQKITDKFLMRFDIKNINTNLKDKMSINSIQDNKYQQNQFFEVFADKKIISKKKNLSQKYRKVHYFSERVEIQQMERREKYKMTKLKLDQSKTEKNQKMQKQRQKNKRIKEAEDRINEIRKEGRAYKEKGQIQEEQASDHERDKQGDNGSRKNSIYEESSS